MCCQDSKHINETALYKTLLFFREHLVLQMQMDLSGLD